MENLVLDQVYRFIPPDRGTFWARHLSRFVLRRYLRSTHGVESIEFLGADRLKASVDAGHGVMLTPNHCRPCDPLALFPLGISVGAPLHVMASWHLFVVSAVQTWVLRRMGVFSVYREGMDREALKCAVQILTDARRPLVLFPEGVISRSNDRLNHLMDGTVFIARNAARQRAAASPPGKVVVHPVAIRYFFQGDVERTIAPVLDDIERRLSWRPQPDQPTAQRIVKVGEALLALKEIEYHGEPRTGELKTRLEQLIDDLLAPLEKEWLTTTSEAGIVARAKALRAAIVPEMVAEKVDEAERARRWRQLADIYLAQQLSHYPPGYFTPAPTPERLLETIERFEEDLTGAARVHTPLHAVIEVGEAIEVPPGRGRGGDGDAIMAAVRASIESMLEGLKARRPGSGAA